MKTWNKASYIIMMEGYLQLAGSFCTCQRGDLVFRHLCVSFMQDPLFLLMQTTCITLHLVCTCTYTQSSCVNSYWFSKIMWPCVHSLMRFDAVVEFETIPMPYASTIWNYNHQKNMRVSIYYDHLLRQARWQDGR